MPYVHNEKAYPLYPVLQKIVRNSKVLAKSHLRYAFEITGLLPAPSPYLCPDPLEQHLKQLVIPMRRVQFSRECDPLKYI